MAASLPCFGGEPENFSYPLGLRDAMAKTSVVCTGVMRYLIDAKTGKLKENLLEIKKVEQYFGLEFD